MKLFFRIFFKTLRFILGPVLLLWDWLTTPKGVVRNEQEQQRIDDETRNLVLYQFRTCPFCIKTRRAIKRLSLKIEQFDAQHDPVAWETLLKGGGEIKVPCLRVTESSGELRWIYESEAIIQYLQRFA